MRGHAPLTVRTVAPATGQDHIPPDLPERLDALLEMAQRILARLQETPAGTGGTSRRAVELAEAVLAGRPHEQLRPLARLLLHGQQLAEALRAAEHDGRARDNIRSPA